MTADLLAMASLPVKVDLASIGWDIAPQDARNLARWHGETPKAFARNVAVALAEAAAEHGRKLPYPTWAIARAIEARMEEE